MQDKGNTIRGSLYTKQKYCNAIISNSVHKNM